MIKKELVIINRLGLHARAAVKLVEVSSKYESHIKLVKDSREVNGKSIMGIMMLAASRGTSVEIIIEGEDEKQALNAIEELFVSRFGEAE